MSRLNVMQEPILLRKAEVWLVFGVEGQAMSLRTAALQLITMVNHVGGKVNPKAARGVEDQGIPLPIVMLEAIWMEILLAAAGAISGETRLLLRMDLRLLADGAEHHSANGVDAMVIPNANAMPLVALMVPVYLRMKVITEKEKGILTFAKLQRF